MKDQGSFPAFAIGFVAGLLWIALGILALSIYALSVYLTGTVELQGSKTLAIELVLTSFYIIIISIWTIFGALWMRYDETLKKGAITSLVSGILSLNLISIIASILGFKAYSDLD